MKVKPEDIAIGRYSINKNIVFCYVEMKIRLLTK